MRKKLIVIGAGMASGRVIEHLVENDPEAYDITLFNAEPRGNYNRIMLSPVLSGEKTYEEIVTHDDSWYATHGVTCRFAEPVLGIDRDNKQLIARDGPVPYHKLVIATGSAPFIIPVPGKDLPGVITYRDLDDTNAMIDASVAGGKAVVIGGGLLGLEAAAGLAERGMDVTVVHLMGHLMERQLDEAAGYLLRKDLEKRGIKIKTNASTKEILGETRAEGVLLEGDETLAADLVVMAVGIRPETRLAADAQLDVARGIAVNAQMQTSDPDVFAVGECVEFDGNLFGLVAFLSSLFGRMIRNTIKRRIVTITRPEIDSIKALFRRFSADVGRSSGGEAAGRAAAGKAASPPLSIVVLEGAEGFSTGISTISSSSLFSSSSPFTLAIIFENKFFYSALYCFCRDRRGVLFC